MITLQEIEERLQMLRERYKVELRNREIIIRMARSLNIAKEMIAKRMERQTKLL